jgi:exopolyphosphatase/guanosine-5'-triphosphate,3'-diphosphate pyrophosphatase
MQLMRWAAMLHEIGMSVSHIGFHKHGAYILQNADMPGFSSGEQAHLALLVFGCRGGLAKVRSVLSDEDVRLQLLALRLAVLFRHARAAIAVPRIRLTVRRRVALEVPGRWLRAHPLTAHLLAKERSQWKAMGFPWKGVRE